ncbi:hypothetical protein C5167_040047 [Papaver somniferum]|uniref:VWFA domain-containing protein n=1 Tax=Papaver somniferum TaxID=3469 RepID=A0A4Y7IHZ8_PAPSO|nr:E3 ubiquitin-protein ligase WAV3-like [Papaver somniferum]RZC47075.1 hypothetical protein C5167_040047 [Papaver somniferum]
MRNEVHDDDEPILRLNGEEEEDADIDLDGGKTEARIFNKQFAPLEECPFKALLELKGIGANEGRLGVDLVTILDISGSMSTLTEEQKKKNEAPKLVKMQLAMQFLVKKLSRVDRLSVVTFNRKAEKLCPLRQITEDSKKEIIDQVNDLKAKSTTNTEAGLKLALKILKDRTRTKNRSVAIMLMTDGIEDAESEAISVPLGNVPVYTFAFGADQCDPEVLSAIAKKSNGGTFSPVPDLDDLSVAFSTALAGLLNVSIEDLTLTVAPLNRSHLNEVNAGNYPKTKQATVMEPVTVTFRSLYDRETRKVLALLTLPKVDARKGIQTYRLVYKYRVNGKNEYDSDTRDINVTRTDKQTDEERPEVLAEEKRIKTASSITAARILADKKKLDEARAELIAAGKSFTQIDAILKSQVDHLILLMVSQETYDEQGSAYARALEASHESQRATALPAGVKSGFEIPLVGEFNKQAKAHSLDPDNYVVPTPEEDKKAVAPPTVEVDEPILDLAHRLAEILKTLDSQAPTKQVDLAKVQEISALSQGLAEKLKELDSQAPSSSS